MASQVKITHFGKRISKVPLAGTQTFRSQKVLDVDMKINQLINQLYPALRETETARSHYSDISSKDEQKTPQTNNLPTQVAKKTIESNRYSKADDQQQKPNRMSSLSNYANNLQRKTQRKGQSSSESDKKANRSLQYMRHSDLSRKKIENNISMKLAQKELDQRLKNRVLKRYENKLKREQNDESYQSIYKRIKTERTYMESSFRLSRHEFLPEVSEQGIIKYEQIADKPGILEYTRKKIIQQKYASKISKFTRLSYKKGQDIKIDGSITNLLHQKRKNLNKILLNTSQQWENSLNSFQNSNAEEVNRRLRKIYSMKKKRQISPENADRIINGAVWREQQQILQSIKQSPDEQSGSGRPRMSKQNNKKLIEKFGVILNEIGRSLPSKHEADYQIQVKSQKLIKKSRQIKHNQDNPFLKDRMHNRYHAEARSLDRLTYQNQKLQSRPHVLKLQFKSLRRN